MMYVYKEKQKIVFLCCNNLILIHYEEIIGKLVSWEEIEQVRPGEKCASKSEF